MFERFKRSDNQNGNTAVADRPATRTRDGDSTTVAERTAVHRDDRAAVREDRPAAREERPAVRERPRDRMHAVRTRQREQYGGINWGAAFFGWLVAVGLGAILVGLLAAAGAAVGLTSLSADDAEIGIGGAIALLVALAIAYYCGGYVAGRMSRFDGPRQGLGTWLLGLIITVVLAVAGAILGSEYNVLEQINLPALPVGESELATGGVIALAIVVVGTLLASIAGGTAGERYHRRIDRVGFDA